MTSSHPNLSAMRLTTTCKPCIRLPTIRYHLHAQSKGVLHDWPDSDCIRILSALKPAMKAGYSRLFIHDMVVDEHRPSAEIAACDMLMMGVTSSKERTDAEWRALLDQAGFKAVKIASHPEAVLSVIWAEPES